MILNTSLWQQGPRPNARREGEKCRDAEKDERSEQNFPSA